MATNSKLIPSYYCNAGVMDKTLQAYIPDSQSTVRPQVMRNGVMVDIKEHNAQLRVANAQVRNQYKKR